MFTNLKGKVEKVQDLELYVVGAGSKCIIWNYDIFGFDSGRTRQTADLFAEAGYLVIIPDFYRGTFREPTAPDVVTWLKEVTNWPSLKQTLEKIVVPFAKSKGNPNPCLDQNYGLHTKPSAVPKCLLL